MQVTIVINSFLIASNLLIFIINVKVVDAVDVLEALYSFHNKSFPPAFFIKFCGTEFLRTTEYLFDFSKFKLTIVMSYVWQVGSVLGL